MTFQAKYTVTPRYLSKPSKRRSGKLIVGGVKFIVAHDTGNPGSTAANNVAYYERSRDEQSASAHIFVDDREILECIPALTAPPEKAWHVLYGLETDNHIYGYDANDAAIGVEYCFGGRIDADEAYRKYVWVIACLCESYQLDPATAVVGHFFLDPKRKTDPVTGLAQSRRTYDQLLKDIVTEYQACAGGVAETTVATVDSAPALQFIEQPGQVVSTAKLNLRKDLPRRTADIVQTLPAGTTLQYLGWVTNGEPVNGNAKWYRDRNGHYFWSGGVTAPAGLATAPAAPSPQPVAAAATSPSTGPDESAIKTALKVTGHFEDSADPFGGVSGDFDGMGISLGVLQWNIGSGSLQPLVQATGREAVLAAMPQHGEEFWTACQPPIRQGLAIVRGWQNGHVLKPSAKSELKDFAHSQAFVDQQVRSARRVADRAWKAAADWNAHSGRGAPDLHQFCWFFDLMTQNGGLKGLSPADVDNFIKQAGTDRADDLVCDWLAGQKAAPHGGADAVKNAELWRNPPPGIGLELLIASYLRAQQSKPEWRVDTLNRKGTIALRSGWTHGEKQDLSGLI